MSEVENITFYSESNAAEIAPDLKGYMHALLTKLWEEGESFSGKRPFGNSGWEYELYEELVRAGKVDGQQDPEYGDLIEFDEDAANQYIFDYIDKLFE